VVHHTSNRAVLSIVEARPAREQAVRLNPGEPIEVRPVVTP